jgi:hypothetical protein
MRCYDARLGTVCERHHIVTGAPRCWAGCVGKPLGRGSSPCQPNRRDSPCRSLGQFRHPAPCRFFSHSESD